MHPAPDDLTGSTETTITPPAALRDTEIMPQESGPAESSMGGWMPSRPASLPAGEAPVDPLSIPTGGRIGEFVVERTLGKGGFGVVYLARQMSLDRQVALKVVSKQGRSGEGEGRSLARLEHENIVQVFGETVEHSCGAQLMWMQYVAGTTLATLVRELKRLGPCKWTGADLLAVLDGLGLAPAMFDPGAMKDRDFLATADHVEAVCRIGEQLAGALGHAHERGVLHRDVKPANVLVSRYGRPLLADFNLASRDANQDESAVFGGTLAYMSPEHLDAFNPDSPTLPEAVDERSDVYSLCVVLWELSSCGHPFPSAGGAVERDEMPKVLGRLAAQRRSAPPERAPVDRRLKEALTKGLAADPADRYESARHLAETVAGLREQRAAMRAFPPVDSVARWSWEHPVTALALATVLPQFVGSALQISYNQIRIVSTFSEAQTKLFPLVVLVYNAVAYPACLGWLWTRFARVVKVWRSLRRGDKVRAEEVDQARMRSLTLPRDTVVAACVGWFPGAFLFPMALHFGADPVSPEAWAHFGISFFLAGLIALTYSSFLETGVVVRTMYVRFWTDPRNFRERAAHELAGVPDRLPAVNVLAGMIPLVGAVLLLLTALLTAKGRGTADRNEEFWFTFLTIGLIVAGGMGYTVVGRLSRRYLQVIDACTGGARRTARKSRRAVKVVERHDGETSFSPGRSSDHSTS